VGKEVVLGIRPEHIGVEVNQPPEGSPNRALVEVTELLGSETYLFVKTGEEDLVARIDPSIKVTVGDVVTLLPDPQRVHLFDPETEASLLL